MKDTRRKERRAMTKHMTGTRKEWLASPNGRPTAQWFRLEAGRCWDRKNRCEIVGMSGRRRPDTYKRVVVGGKSLRSKSGVELKLKVWMSKLEIRANSDQ
jgi:hypothetical protein